MVVQDHGKTSLVFEPMIAKDIERKQFFINTSKELGYTALKTRIATLNKPYDNGYLNKNFNLNMISPTIGKETIFNAFLNKMYLGTYENENIYRNLGFTVVSPDFEITEHMSNVCKNYGLNYDIVDPNNVNSIGLNPFVYDDPSKIAITISSALKAMYTHIHHTDSSEVFREDVSNQAIENLAILLKEVYPKLHEGMLPNLEDLLKLMNNFDLVEKMAEIMNHDEELSARYNIQIDYYKKHFYKNGSGRDYTTENIYPALTQLDSLLRLPGVKKVLCNRTNNVDFDKMLSEGKLTFVCTRRGDLGAASHKAFGLFFLISMQNAVLRRPR